MNQLDIQEGDFVLLSENVNFSGKYDYSNSIVRVAQKEIYGHVALCPIFEPYDACSHFLAIIPEKIVRIATREEYDQQFIKSKEEEWREF